MVVQSNPSPAGWDGCARSPFCCAQHWRALRLRSRAPRLSSSIPAPSRLRAAVPRTEAEQLHPSKPHALAPG